VLPNRDAWLQENAYYDTLRHFTGGGYMRGLASIILFLTLVPIQGATERKGWRGIVPLHSTRADVEQLLGPPPPPPKDGTWLYTPNPDMPLYFFDDEDVRIGYMTDAFAERMSCSAYPNDTVIGVVVYLKKQPLLSDLRIDESKFETFDPSTPQNIGYKAFVNTTDGTYICTAGGKVNELGYYGDARDRQICPALDREPKQFCHVLVDFYKSKKSKND
jgi:hypothetical protein